MANQANKNTEFPQAHSSHMQSLLECMAVCAACAKKCLEEGHKKTAGLCAECADVCSLAVKACSGQSEFENDIMQLCASVCQKCSEECKRMESKHCQECAEVCKQCTAACSGSHSML